MLSGLGKWKRVSCCHSQVRARDLQCMEVPTAPNPNSVQRVGIVSWSPWGQPHHHLDVPVVDGDAADVGGRLPEGNALLVQLTAAQDEAWRNLLSSHDCSPRSSGDPTHNPQAEVLCLGPQGPRSRLCWLCSCVPQTSALLGILGGAYQVPYLQEPCCVRVGSSTLGVPCNLET